MIHTHTHTHTSSFHHCLPPPREPQGLRCEGLKWNVAKDIQLKKKVTGHFARDDFSQRSSLKAQSTFR